MESEARFRHEPQGLGEGRGLQTSRERASEGAGEEEAPCESVR